MSKTLPEKIEETASFLRAANIDGVDAAVILGTGLGGEFVKALDDALEIEYEQIPNFEQATVDFHNGKLVYGTLAGKKVLAFHGRFHYYEGYGMEIVTFPVRIARALDANMLLISNAAGCMNLDWELGDLVMLDDHINLQTENPLRGAHFNSLGSRFPDMSCPYDTGLRERLRNIALEQNIVLREGIYAGVVGPNLETRAEYRFLRMIGADLVGMSTVPEVIVAKQAELPCIAVSVITDICDPDNLRPVDIQEIIQTAEDAEPVLTRLFRALIASGQ